MDIAALSIGLSQGNLARQVGVSVMKMGKESAEAEAAALIQMMQETTKIMDQIAAPHLGANIDIMA